MRRLLPIAIALPGLAAAGQPLAVFDANVAAGLQPVPGTVAVGWDPGTDLDLLERAAAAAGCVPDHRWGQRRAATYRCASDVPPRVVLARLGALPGVRWAQVPFRASLSATPSDLTDRQWHHRNTGQRIAGVGGLPGADIGSVEAWDVSIGSPDVLVAVPDTGVYVDHAELQGRIAGNAGEICDNGLDDDGNGYADDCAGWDFADGDANPDPRALPSRMPSGAPCPAVHGTFIAGLIAGATDNATGVAGIAWDGRILPLKISADGTCEITDLGIAEAISYAVDRGAKVMNVSWTFDGFSPALVEAFSEADGAGMFFAMAAGNSNADVDATSLYPLRYDLRHKLVVAASDNRDRRAGFSNYGRTTVDLAAPGWELWSAGIAGPTSHVGGSGTSYAAPLVAGVAALILAEFPVLRPIEVRRAILDGATPIPGLSCAAGPRCVASGARLDADGALTEAAWWATAPQLSATLEGVEDAVGGDADGVLERGELADLVFAVRNDGHGPADGAIATLTVEHPHARGPAPIPLATLAPGGDGTLRARVAVARDCLEDGVANVRLDLVDAPTGAATTASFELPIPCLIDEDADGALYPDDCDDGDPAVFPGADERCNGLDDDCDGTTDEPDALDAIAWFPDADGDGFGAAGEPVTACLPPEGFGWSDEDCDDAAPDVHPAATESCDGRDEDCDGRIDDDPADPRTFYEDLDGDGWGGARSVSACEAPRATTERPGDCDDRHADVWPGSPSHDTDCAPRPSGGCTTTPGLPTPLALFAGLGLALLGRRTAATGRSRRRTG